MSKKFSPFGNGSEYRDWVSRNCEGCSKSVATTNPDVQPEDMPCRIEAALVLAEMTDGRVPLAIARRVGAAADRPGHFGPCPEKVP